MKNSFKKIMASLGAAAMLVSAMPIANAFAADAVDPADLFETREVADGVIITNYTGENTDKITIPATINDADVVGVDNFAFGLVSQNVTIVVPETLRLKGLDATENDGIDANAFMTAGVIINQDISGYGSTPVEIITQIIADVNDKLPDAQKFVFPDGVTPEEYISEAMKRAMAHLAGAPTGNTPAETAIIVIETILDETGDHCGFSQKNVERLKAALNLISYKGVTLEGPKDAPAQTYAENKIDLTYNEKSSVIIGDANLNGKVDFLDLTVVSKALINDTLTGDARIAADVNGNGEIDFLDLSAIAKMLIPATN